MITYDHIMVRFGELSTKGKNKKDFIRVLADNIRNALKEFNNLTIDVRYDHIYVGLNGSDFEPILARLQDVSGIYSLSLVYKCERDINVMKDASLELIKQKEGKTFKVICSTFEKLGYKVFSKDYALAA